MKKRWHEVIPELDGQKIGCRSNQIVNTSVASNRLAERVSDSSCPPASRRCLSLKGCWRWREAISGSWHAENKPVVIVVWICYFAIYLFIKLQSFFLSEFYTCSFVMVVLIFLITFNTLIDMDSSDDMDSYDYSRLLDLYKIQWSKFFSFSD